jgi:hypothetical protein
VGVVWQKLSLEVEEMRADERFQKKKKKKKKRGERKNE